MTTTDHTTLTADNLTDRLAPASGGPAADLVRAARGAAARMRHRAPVFEGWAALVDDLALALQLAAAAEAAGAREMARLRAENDRRRPRAGPAFGTGPEGWREDAAASGPGPESSGGSDAT